MSFKPIIPTSGPFVGRFGFQISLISFLIFQFPSDLPYFIEDLHDTSVRYGDPIELRAQIGSRHEFGFKWTYPDIFRKDIIISAPSDCGIITLLLPNANLKDYGRYHISIANKYGKVTSGCTVHVIREPSKPLKFEYVIDPAKKKAIRLRWSQPENLGGSKIVWYTVEYTRPGLDQYYDVIKGIKENCIRISHLQDTVYTFRVFAFNEYFSSKFFFVLGEVGRG